MRRILVGVVMLLAIASYAQAQTVPVTPAQFLAWDHDGVNLQSQQVCVGNYILEE